MGTKTTVFILMGTLLLAGVLLLSFDFRKSLSLSEFEQHYRSVEYEAQYAKEIGNYVVKVKYRPVAYHFGKMSRGDRHIADSLIRENDSVIFFDMKIDGLGANSPLFEGDQQLLEERLMYFMAKVKQDLFLVDEGETYRLLNHHLERNYNITNAINIQLAFSKPKGEAFTFTYNDRMLGMGRLNFAMDQNEIQKNLPRINR